MTRQTHAWALGDPLARPAWTIVERCGDGAVETVDRWSNDDDFWVRRLALLCLMPGLINSGEHWDRWVGYANSMIHEKEFFIRKAIGWTLREVSKVRPEPVSEFVSRHVDVISGVSFREAVKYLPEPEKSELWAAYKAR
jgi:3-methyladenine DNA glycosylase AlkD